MSFSTYYRIFVSKNSIMNLFLTESFLAIRQHLQWILSMFSMLYNHLYVLRFSLCNLLNVFHVLKSFWKQNLLWCIYFCFPEFGKFLVSRPFRCVLTYWNSRLWALKGVKCLFQVQVLYYETGAHFTIIGK